MLPQQNEDSKHKNEELSELSIKNEDAGDARTKISSNIELKDSIQPQSEISEAKISTQIAGN